MLKVLRLACIYKICKIHEHFALVVLLYVFGSSVHSPSKLLLSYAMPSAYTSMRVEGGSGQNPSSSSPGLAPESPIDQGILKGDQCIVRDHDRTGRRKRS